MTLQPYAALLDSRVCFIERFQLYETWFNLQVHLHDTLGLNERH